MKTFILLPTAAVAGALVLSSCSTVKTTATKVGEGSRELTSDFEGPRIASLFRKRPYVAEVREKDLKKMPTGEERALAFEETRRRSFWDIFRGPVNFDEPDLPEDGSLIDGSLLPPKQN
jgi:hypothetical protein